MTHALGVSDHIKERMRKLRGDLRIFKDLEPEERRWSSSTCRRPSSSPVVRSRCRHHAGSSTNINRAASGFRELGMPVIWIRSMHPTGAADWRHFFDHFVHPERRERAAAAMSDDARGSQFYKEMDVRKSTTS